MSALKAWMDTWPLPEGEPFKGETIRAEGWQYRDLSRMTHAAWDEIRNVIGAENVRAMTWADYGDSCRGQIWISPAGIANLKARIAKSRN